MSPSSSSTAIMRPQARRRRRSSTCNPALDANLKHIPTLASLRILVLAQLTDIEARLALLEPLKKLDSEVDDAKLWVAEAVHNTREHVVSHLPELHLELSSVETLVRPYLPDWAGLRAQLPRLDDVRARLDFDLQEVCEDVRSRLPEWDTIIAATRAHISDLDERLQSLNAHLITSSISLPEFSASKLLSEFVDRVLSSDILADLREDESTEKKEEAMALRTIDEIQAVLKISDNGRRLVSYNDLPAKFQNNEHVQHGYRFIPLSNWPVLALSVFRVHNETIHIHTHLLPLLLSLLAWLPVLGSQPGYADMPDQVYTHFARLCLLTSSIWHVFSGCADVEPMEFFARLDYVGIGWLISASVATVVYYGLSCHPQAAAVYLAACAMTGIAGSVLPFMQWFNERKHKKWRIAFFLSVACTGIAPVVHLSFIHSTSSAVAFVSPIFPSLATYIVGLVLYACHIPECYLPKPLPSWLWWTDWVGGGSHAIWHVLIVFAIRWHRAGMDGMRGGFQGEVCKLLA